MGRHGKSASYWQDESDRCEQLLETTYRGHACNGQSAPSNEPDRVSPLSAAWRSHPVPQNKDIRVAAYGPLIPIVKKAGGPLDPKLDELARKYAVNPGEILLRWAMIWGLFLSRRRARSRE